MINARINEEENKYFVGNNSRNNCEFTLVIVIYNQLNIAVHRQNGADVT